MSTQKDKQENTTQESTAHQEIDFHGATVIDANGNEVNITEDMVQDACHKLEPELDDEDEPQE